MSTTAENAASQIIICEYINVSPQHMLALVQSDKVISTFPEDQTDAAIDLARVLCRALTQPIDLFRVHFCDLQSVQARANVNTAGPGWTHVAHLQFSFDRGVDVVMCDPVWRENLADQYQAP